MARADEYSTRSGGSPRNRSAGADLGLAGAVAEIGYAPSRAAGREGRVFWRRMAVDAGGVPGSVVILTAWLEDDGSVSRTIHPAYAAAFEDRTHVSKELHRDLNRAFGADEPYYLVRNEARDCNGIPGDEEATPSRSPGPSSIGFESATA